MGALDCKVILPSVASGVKEFDNPAGIGVDARQIWALVSVAPIASPGKIGRFVAAAVLLCHDVLNVEGQRRRCIRQETVFAPAARTKPNEIAEFGLLYAPFCFKNRRALA